jgi:two-component system, OmpR family, phosphate regulon response regulator PhoB
MTKILLVEDDQSLGATLRERLSKEGFEVSWAVSKKESLSLVEKVNFDLYIFDVGLPDGSGFELARILPTRPFIFMTAQGDAESRLHGYELGAEEFIPKPFHLRELLLRVKHVLTNHAVANRLEIGGVIVDFESFTFTRDGSNETVASKDLLFLKLLVRSSPKVVSRDEALNELRGEDKFPSNRTVDNAVLRLRAALGDKVSTCLESVRGVGYRWNPDNSQDKTDRPEKKS